MSKDNRRWTMDHQGGVIAITSTGLRSEYAYDFVVSVWVTAIGGQNPEPLRLFYSSRTAKQLNKQE